MTLTLAELRTYEESILNLPSGDSYVSSTLELQHLNIAYEKTAYRFDWPQTMKRFADVVVAANDRYNLQTDFRKFRWLKVLDVEKEEVEFNGLGWTDGTYAVDSSTSEYILHDIPQTASTAYTTSGSLSAGNSVTITLDTTTGISVGDEIFISDTTSSEFTKVQTVPTSTTITAKIKNSHTSGKSVYRSVQLITHQYYKKITALASSGDLTILPDETDFIIPHYAAYLYYIKLEEFDRAKAQFELWDDQIKDAWKAWDKASTGPVGEFSIG